MISFFLFILHLCYVNRRKQKNKRKKKKDETVLWNLAILYSILIEVKMIRRFPAHSFSLLHIFFLFYVYQRTKKSAGYVNAFKKKKGKSAEQVSKLLSDVRRKCVKVALRSINAIFVLNLKKKKILDEDFFWASWHLHHILASCLGILHRTIRDINFWRIVPFVYIIYIWLFIIYWTQA